MTENSSAVAWRGQDRAPDPPLHGSELLRPGSPAQRHLLPLAGLPFTPPNHRSRP